MSIKVIAISLLLANWLVTEILPINLPRIVLQAIANLVMGVSIAFNFVTINIEL